MTSVFLAFLLSTSVVVKMLALGLGVSVLVDATIIRLLVVFTEQPACRRCEPGYMGGQVLQLGDLGRLGSDAFWVGIASPGRVSDGAGVAGRYMRLLRSAEGGTTPLQRIGRTGPRPAFRGRAKLDEFVSIARGRKTAHASTRAAQKAPQPRRCSSMLS